MDKDRVLKTLPCIIDRCDGVMSISNTKATKSNGIVKLKANCTSCGYHALNTKKGQETLRNALDNLDPNNAKDNNYIFDNETNEASDEKINNSTGTLQDKKEPEKKDYENDEIINGSSKTTKIIASFGVAFSAILIYLGVKK